MFLSFYTGAEEFSIIPFASHGGSGLGTGPDEITELAPNATLLDGIEVSASNVKDSQSDIEKWIDGLGIINK